MSAQISLNSLNGLEEEFKYDFFLCICFSNELKFM